MKTIKSIIFDYDGTVLLKNQKEVSSTIRLLFTKLRQANILVILATGRPLAHCQYLIDENLVDYIVSTNGSLVTSKYGHLTSTTISQKTVQSCMGFCTEHYLPSTFYTTNLLTNGTIDDNMIIGLRESMNVSVSELDVIQESHPKDIYLMCFFCKENIDDLLRQTFPKQYISRWHPNIVSILEDEVTKTTGITEILAHHQIKPSDCVAVGDGENDTDMLQMAGLAIAVGKNKKLIEIADISIDRVDENFLSILKNLLNTKQINSY